MFGEIKRKIFIGFIDFNLQKMVVKYAQKYTRFMSFIHFTALIKYLQRLIDHRLFFRGPKMLTKILREINLICILNEPSIKIDIKTPLINFMKIKK